MINLFRASMLVLITCLGSTPAFAEPVSVHIDTGNYNGIWEINGNKNTGSSDIELEPGSYSIQISQIDSLEFSVASDGIVSSLTPEAATGSVNSLTLNTAPINFDPVAYEGKYRIIATYNPWFSGLQEIELVTGLDYQLGVGAYNSSNFHVNPDGTVVSQAPNSIEGNVSTLTFKNVTIQIDPIDYIGSYHIWGGTNLLQNLTSVVIVPNLSYYMELGLSSIGFQLDAAGNITSVTHPESISFENNKVIFKTTPITIDPANYKGGYYLRRGPNDFSGYGLETFIQVVGTTTHVTIGNLNHIKISIDGSGNVVETSRDDVLELYGDTIVFKNIDIEMTASGADFSLLQNFAGAVSVADGETVVVSLVPNLSFYAWVAQLNGVNTNLKSIIEVQDPCAVVPGSLDFSNSNGSGTLAFSCPSPVIDIDEDSIPDETDNCPLLANTNQLDMDEDNIGDVCDADKDGDNIENTIDNCPATSNIDQLDLDSDGFGNACDSDVDGDGVQDVLDNCPLIANAGQGNSDHDQHGDACDVDDDNDGKLDVEDNCPVTPNTNQSDIDADGEGDMCDGDRDGDGVENGADQCPATPTGTNININGCNGAQFIAMSCDASEFKNHGQYVSCVSSAAKEAVNLDLIKKKDKSTFVTEAAQEK